MGYTIPFVIFNVINRIKIYAVLLYWVDFFKTSDFRIWRIFFWIKLAKTDIVIVFSQIQKFPKNSVHQNNNNVGFD